jgi:hypothetical protein
MVVWRFCTCDPGENGVSLLSAISVIIALKDAKILQTGRRIMRYLHAVNEAHLTTILKNPGGRNLYSPLQAVANQFHYGQRNRLRRS